MKRSPSPGRSSAKGPDAASRDKAILLARTALDKKARNILLLNVGPLTTIAEYFVICSGVSVRHTRSIAEHLLAESKGGGLLPFGVEGEEEGTWILLDFDDVVIHVFHEPTRELYDLEELWADAPRLIDPEIEREQAAEGTSPEEDSWEP